jgi:hypothetical protein
MATYTNLEEVSRILRSLSGEKIRFSKSLIEVSTLNQNNSVNLDILFNYSNIEYNPDFSKQYILKFVFEDDQNFLAIEVNTAAKREIALSAGNINNEYSTPDSMITIPVTCWGGTFKPKDKIELRFSPHISDNNALDYIKDAETIIDQMLEANGIHFPVQGQDTFFLSGEVPRSVKVATTYLACYLIYTDTFAEAYRDRDEGQVNFLNRWQKRAEELIYDYMTAKGARAPSVISFPWFIDSIGDPDVGPGLSKVTEDFDTVTRDAAAEDIFGSQG